MLSPLKSPYTFAGRPVVVHSSRIVVRTWRERLFTRPWRPLQVFKVVEPVIPAGQAIVVDGRFHMREETWRKLQDELAQMPPANPCHGITVYS